MIDDSLKNFSDDPRHTRRALLMQQLFAYSFFQDKGEQIDLSQYQQVEHIIEKLDQIDQQIAAFAPERPLKDINKVDLSILRLIIFESQTNRTPVKVLINEAIELAKEFGSESSPKFINGVLAKLLGEKNEK